MNENDFKETKTGKLVWEQNGMYYRFEPNKLPLVFQEDEELKSLLVETSINLGRLDGMAHKFSKEETHLILTPFMIKEATSSSEIEGTQATLDEVYKNEKEKEEDREKALDIQEIKNYEEALYFGLKDVENKPLTEELIKRLHEILLQGVRGQNKSPGKYKETQNSIGKRSDNLDTAKFVPASPQTVTPLMNNMLKFFEEDPTNILYKLALMHYQFEAIHPFRDGNGRIGRLLILLSLYKQGILKQPLIYISEYFNSNRDEYTQRMYDLSSKGNILEWVKFFLKIVLKCFNLC